MGPIRLVNLISSSGIGGCASMLRCDVARYTAERMDVSIANFGPGRVPDSWWTEFGSTYASFPERPPSLACARRLYAYLTEQRPHIVNVIGLRMNLIARPVARAVGVPVLTSTVRGLDDWRKWYHVLADRLTSGLVDMYVANSKAAERVCRDRERIVPSKLTVVYDGLDLSTFVLNDSRNEIRRTLGLTDSSRIVFITPANFRPQKAHHVLVAAIGQCQSRLGNCEFWFVGAGELRRVIEERVRQAGLAGSVRFMGVRTDIPRLLHAADVLVLPSVFESLPRTIMEAMAASKPVIATRVGGVCEVVIDGRTGLIVPPGEPGPLAEALVLMATDPEYRSRMGLAGRLRAEERYDVRKCLVRTEQLYRRLVLRKARRLETVCSRSEGREPGDGVSNQCRR